VKQCSADSAEHLTEYEAIDMYKIDFEYRDNFSNGNWNKQSCIMESIEECKKFYGLGVDCEYRITNIEKIVIK